MLFTKLTWIDDATPRAASLNMALDEALLRTVTCPLLRAYRWERPAVSFGYFGKHREVVLGWPQMDWVRRWTGGGVVLHGEDLTFSLVVPRGHAVALLPAAEAYAQIHQAVAAALGAAARLATTPARAVSAACFENPVVSDVLIGTQKAAGGAQRRTREGLLHQGSARGIADRAAFETRLAGALASQVERLPLPPDILSAAQTLAQTKYGTASWLRRY